MHCYQTLCDDAIRWKYDGCIGRQLLSFGKRSEGLQVNIQRSAPKDHATSNYRCHHLNLVDALQLCLGGKALFEMLIDSEWLGYLKY